MLVLEVLGFKGFKDSRSQRRFFLSGESVLFDAIFVRLGQKTLAG